MEREADSKRKIYIDMPGILVNQIQNGKMTRRRFQLNPNTNTKQIELGAFSVRYTDVILRLIYSKN